MRCETIRKGEDVIILCGRGRRQRCTVCRERPATQACDGPKPNGKRGTCDRPLCTTCSARSGSRDYCPPHAGHADARPELPLEARPST